MYDIRKVTHALKDARLRSGLTQQELAARAGTSQSAIAGMERGDTNPTVETLVRCAGAMDISLQVALQPMHVPDPVVERYKQDVDRTLLRENLRKSVDERLRTLAGWQDDLRKLQRATAQAGRGGSKAAGRRR